MERMQTLFQVLPFFGCGRAFVAEFLSFGI